MVPDIDEAELVVGGIVVRALEECSRYVEIGLRQVVSTTGQDIK